MIDTYAEPKVSQVICDKLYVTFKVDEDDHQHVLSKFYQLNEAGYAKTIYTPMYKKSLRLDVNNNDLSTVIQCNPHEPKNAFFRLECNPNKIGPHGMAEVRKYCDEVLPNGYQGIVDNGICTRIDTTVDMEYASIDRLLFKFPGMQLSKAYYSKEKIMESLYIGGDEGQSTQICIYDKVKQAKKYNQVHPLNPIKMPKAPTVRIEIRHKKRRPLTDFASLPNLLKKLGIYSFHRVKHSDWVFGQFLENARHQGLQKALYGVPNDGTRKSYLNRIKAAPLASWQPDEHWKSWEDISSLILNPPLLQKHALPLIA